MTDTYYSKEEDVKDTPETALANWNASSSQMDGIVVETAAKLNRNFEILDWVESQVSEEAQPFIQESKAITHEMATRIAEFDTVRLQANTFMKEMFDRQNRVALDYEELEQAVSSADRSHPLVDNLIDDVEENVAEMMYDEQRIDAAQEYEDAFAEAYDNVFTELHEGIREITGCRDWTLVYRLTNVLTSQEEPTDEQRDLLTRLVASFQKESDAS